MASTPPRPRKTTLTIRIVAVSTFIAAVLVGVVAGISIAETVNVKNQENFVEFAPALPTKLLDINGELITEFPPRKNANSFPSTSCPST
jgi:penicillin-binding protein 1A